MLVVFIEAVTHLKNNDMDHNIQKTTMEQKGDWKPIIFLFTDGNPTDDYAAALDCFKRIGVDTKILDNCAHALLHLLYGGSHQTIEVDEDHIIALLNISENQMHSNWSLGNLLGGEGLSMMRVTGPGTEQAETAADDYFARHVGNIEQPQYK